LPGEKAGGALMAFLAQHGGVVTVVPASEPLWPVYETAAAIRVGRQERQMLTGRFGLQAGPGVRAGPAAFTPG
jgi:hypothetical protein